MFQYYQNHSLEQNEVSLVYCPLDKLGIYEVEILIRNNIE